MKDQELLNKLNETWDKYSKELQVSDIAWEEFKCDVGEILLKWKGVEE